MGLGGRGAGTRRTRGGRGADAEAEDAKRDAEDAEDAGQGRGRRRGRTCETRRTRGGVRFSKRIRGKPHDACQSGRSRNSTFLRVGTDMMQCFSKRILWAPDVSQLAAMPCFWKCMLWNGMFLSWRWDACRIGCPSNWMFYVLKLAPMQCLSNRMQLDVLKLAALGCLSNRMP